MNTRVTCGGVLAELELIGDVHLMSFEHHE